VTRGDDYKSIVRRGVRVGARGLTVSVLARERATSERLPEGSAATPTRFGFIISKRVGVAVVRNRLRRRLKHISRELLPSLPDGLDVVYRVHPEAADLPFDELRERAVFGVRRCLKRLGVEARSSAASEASSPGSPASLAGARDAHAPES